MIGRSRLALTLCVFAAAFLVRGFYLLEFRDNPTAGLPVVDARTYDRMARDIAAGGEISRDFFWQPPLYPLFLSGVYALTGGSTTAAKLLQMIIGAFTAVFAAALGARIFGRAAGFAAGMIVAFYMPLVFYEGELLAAGWAAFLGLALILALVRAAEKPAWGRHFAVGLAGFAGIAFRPELALFFVAGVAWLLANTIRRLPAKRAAGALAGAAAGILVVAVPVGLLGLAATGTFRILPFSAGINLYIGNNPEGERTTSTRPGSEWEKIVALPEAFGLREIDEKEAFFREQTLGYVFSQPGRFALGLAGKARRFFTSREIPRNVDIYAFREWSSLLRWGVWKAGRFGFPFGLLLALAVVGAAARPRAIPAPAWIFLGFYPLAVILVFVTARYRIPYVPVLAVLAAGGAGSISEAFGKRRWGKAFVLLAIAGAVLAAGAASPLFREERRDYRAELAFFVGVALEDRGRFAEAVASYEEALERRPDYADAAFNLGVLWEKRGNAGEAEALYRRAVSIDPEHANAQYNLGVLLQSHGRIEEAVEVYRRAVRVAPADVHARNNLATALRAAGNLGAAIRQYRIALDYNGGFVAAHSNLGYALSAEAQWDAAISHFRKAATLDPSSVPALVGLSRAILGRTPGPGGADAAEAIASAERAAGLTGRRDPRILRTLAEAVAAAGDAGRAADVAREAAEAAESAGAADLAAELRRLEEKFRARLRTPNIVK